MPADSSHLRANNLQGIDGLSIPYWAVKDCLNVMRCVIESERLTDGFITGLLESYIRDVAALPRNGPVSQLRNMMVDELINGDPHYGGENLTDEITEYIKGLDHVVLYDAPDFQEALETGATENTG